MIKKKHKRYLHLMWVLAKTDFKMRYHASILGYVWAVLKPLLIFLILNFVFSHVFGRGRGIENYSLQLITGIVVWTYFNEGTNLGLTSLLSKSNILTKIYFPRWIIVISSTINSTLIFFMNIFILVAFYIYYNVYPSITEILFSFVYILLTYGLIVTFSFFAAPLYLRFRDLKQIWEVILQGLFFAAPIIYPLYVMPAQYHKYILLNPMGIIIHYLKVTLIEDRLPNLSNHLLFFILLALFFIASLVFFKITSKKAAEYV
ncbi:MAG: hypothetical protein GF335_04490 [Candidatus Moranbacteria bacterium]|nr:hypothetical protein [Candidatus Moranbacteria bacterium]